MGRVREELVADWGGRYSPEAQRAMMGMSSPEWSRYMHDELGLPQSPEEINDEVVRRMLERYEADLPLIDGAVDAVVALAADATARGRIVVEPAADRRRARDGRDRGASRRPSRRRRWRAASRAPTSTSRLRAGSGTRPGVRRGRGLG